jgi:hypothetical protein
MPFELPFSVMAGLVPAIHAAPLPANPKLFLRLDDVAECACIRPDDRDKPGHDGSAVVILAPHTPGACLGTTRETPSC